jgi:hypothetical protein
MVKRRAKDSPKLPQLAPQPGKWVEQISVLGSAEHELLCPIDIIVEQVGDGDYIARCIETGIVASGENRPDAIEKLQDMHVGYYEHLSKIPSADLGPGPRHQLAVLRSYIRERP